MQNRIRVAALTCASLLSLSIATLAQAQSDLFIRDTPSDTGVEPYTGPGPVYVSPDIWIRKAPDPNFDPHPYTAATWTPLADENPEYRDPKRSEPNYVYVRVQNRGTSPSTGTERLRLYQAKASTGLSWPASWIDNMLMACSKSLLHGIEITKPRRNAKSVSDPERLAYRNAVIAAASDVQFRYNDAVQYFAKQNVIHNNGPEHGNPAFLPWHREMVNRFELLLQEVNPLVTLLYWDFTQQPTSGTNLFTDDFMGTSNGTIGGPLGAALPSVNRNYTPTTCTFDNDATLLGATFSDYAPFSLRVENWPRNHDCAHVTVGGGGDLNFASTAARDPFFFQLHANVDRQWATWQRSGADPQRVDPVGVYDPLQSHPRLNAGMRPWDGSLGVTPWSGAPGLATVKTSFSPSVVFPPIYDTAPLNIPVLQPNESIVLEIPWYPPNVNNFNCAGDSGHFCLLARIETDVNAPFGMTSTETINLASNTVENNNIAWKNVNIVDAVTEPQLRIIAGTSVQNIFDREAVFVFRLTDRTEKRRFLLQEYADLAIALPDDILKRVLSEKGQLQDVVIDEMKGLDRKVLRITGKEPAFRILMKPGERFNAQFAVQLRTEKPVPELLEERFMFDIEQDIDLPREFFGKRNANATLIGGVRFEIDVNRMIKNGKDDNLKLAQLRLQLQTDISREISSQGAENQLPRVLSPGEPLTIIVNDESIDSTLGKISLEVDGEVRASVDDKRQLTETFVFEKEGLHTIVVSGRNADGKLIEKRSRIMVSANIPPHADILSPRKDITVKMGETVTFETEVIAAFRRSIGDVTLHVKDNHSFAGGTNLVEGNFPVVDKANGAGPHKLKFTPTKPGHFMLQVGVRDDEGKQGVSGHVMIMVTE